jgi:hypothetical protein
MSGPVRRAPERARQDVLVLVLVPVHLREPRARPSTRRGSSRPGQRKRLSLFHTSLIDRRTAELRTTVDRLGCRPPS